MAIAILTSALALHTGTARADLLDDVLSILSTAGVVDPAVVEAKPMIQCLVDGKSVEVCAEFAAGQAQGFVPNDPKIQKVVDVFYAVKANDWLEVFLLAGEQVVCSLVPGGAVKDLFCGEIFDVAEPVITSAYEAVMDGNVLKLVSAIGVEYACALLPSAPLASELCGVLGEIVAGIAKGVEAAVGALGSLVEDIAGQTQHMSVEQYYVKYWRPWLEYAVVKQLHFGEPAYLYAGKYASSSTSCAEYFDSHKMSASNADKVCGIMKTHFLEEVAEAAKVFQAFPSTFFAGWAAPRIPGWAAAYYHKLDEFSNTVAGTQWNGQPLAKSLLYSDAPFKNFWSQCDKQKPLILPGIPGPNQGVHNADKVMMGTAISWACTRAGQLLADALQQQKAKIDGLGGQLTALGCAKSTPLPAVRYSCPSYDSFRKCSAIYPSESASVSDNLCWIQRHTADPLLAKEIVAELGSKRCGAMPQSVNVQCSRPWKKTLCESLVAALSEGPPGKSAVTCFGRVDSSFVAASQQAQSIIKSMNTKPGGMGAVDPATGTTQGQVLITQAYCATAPKGAWDPLRIACKDESAKKELDAKLPTCLPDSNKDGADAPCYDGPTTLASDANPSSVAKPAVPFPHGGSPRIVDVEFDFFERAGPTWTPVDTPSVGAMVAIRCIYEYAHTRTPVPAPEWSVGFMEGAQNVLAKAVGPGPVDRAGRVTRTWYGTLLTPGPVELGCVADVDGELAGAGESANRVLKALDVPGPVRARSTPAADRGPRIAQVTPRQAALARGGPPALDLQFTDLAGIKRTTDAAGMRRAQPLQSATVGQSLAIDCSYIVSMDAPNGEPVTLEPWQVSIERDGRALKSVEGATEVVSSGGVSMPGRLVERWTPSEPGDYRFHCRLDTGGAIVETDEANNEMELTIAVSGSTRAR
ncbi:MAG: hypothetical protein WD795_15880 [Woeseia sp.]